MKNIATSLQKFHEKMGNVAKDASNPFFHSKYAPLESILPAIKGPLAEAGLVFTQIPTGICKLKTILIDVASGETIEGEFEMNPSKNDPQGQASTITYMRRYALVSILGLNCDEDDDGNKASEKPAKAPKTASTTKNVLTPETALKNAKMAITKAATLDILNMVQDNINDSDILTDKEKTELTFMATERRDVIGPF